MTLEQGENTVKCNTAGKGEQGTLGCYFRVMFLLINLTIT